MKRPKLHKPSCAKPLIELERRLNITKQEPFAVNDTQLIIPLGEPSECTIPFLEGALMYASVSYNSEQLAPEDPIHNFWVVNVQFAARPIDPKTPMFDTETNTTVLEAIGNMIRGSYNFMLSPISWTVENDFVLNPTQPDYECTVLSCKFINLHDKVCGVSTLMQFIKQLKNLPAVEMVEETKQ